MQIRSKALELQKSTTQLFNDKKYNEAIFGYKQIIDLHKDIDKLSCDDLRLLAACHVSISEAYINLMINKQIGSGDTDLAYGYVKSTEYLQAIPIEQKTDKDFRNLGCSYGKLGKFASLTDYTKAGKLFVLAAEAFMNAGELQYASNFLQEFNAIKDKMIPKASGLKMTFLSDMNTAQPTQSMSNIEQHNLSRSCNM